MNRRPSLVVMSAALLLAGCDASQDAAAPSAAPAETDLRGATIGGPFALTDQDGKQRNWAEFQGRYRIVYFGYTYCPDVCPLDLQRIAQGFRLFEKQAPARAAKVQPIFISVDPERDTPAALKTYVTAFHPRLIGLTGTEAQIATVAKSFVTVYSKVTQKNGAYLVSHTRTPILFGPEGAPLVMLPVDDTATPQAEGTPEQIADALDRWVK
ncbi:MAG: SCO family protein [Sphingobium sp.]|nr:SCO family protein [Sphingobium sp.]MBP6112247.1 SCO family protein [Sphingobium sp.]MBP8671526.1 SCO family protein [Sphingobium sp.]MBP9157334.1 SCO family protein [Sphingobium sp.]MCC6482949.1 SCO family protein [Sphingomonadaceae bacterium]